MFSQSKKVAILPVLDKNNEVSNMYKLMIRTAISKAINETKEYTALEREYEISENQKTNIDADYICLLEVASDNNQIVISASIL